MNEKKEQIKLMSQPILNSYSKYSEITFICFPSLFFHLHFFALVSSHYLNFSLFRFLRTCIFFQTTMISLNLFLLLASVTKPQEFISNLEILPQVFSVDAEELTGDYDSVTGLYWIFGKDERRVWIHLTTIFLIFSGKRICTFNNKICALLVYQ